MDTATGTSFGFSTEVLNPQEWLSMEPLSLPTAGLTPAIKSTTSIQPFS